MVGRRKKDHGQMGREGGKTQRQVTSERRRAGVGGKEGGARCRKIWNNWERPEAE